MSYTGSLLALRFYECEPHLREFKKLKEREIELLARAGVPAAAMLWAKTCLDKQDKANAYKFMMIYLVALRDALGDDTPDSLPNRLHLISYYDYDNVIQPLREWHDNAWMTPRAHAVAGNTLAAAQAASHAWYMGLKDTLVAFSVWFRDILHRAGSFMVISFGVRVMYHLGKSAVDIYRSIHELNDIRATSGLIAVMTHERGFIQKLDLARLLPDLVWLVAALAMFTSGLGIFSVSVFAQTCLNALAVFTQFIVHWGIAGYSARAWSKQANAMHELKDNIVGSTLRDGYDAVSTSALTSTAKAYEQKAVKLETHGKAKRLTETLITFGYAGVTVLPLLISVHPWLIIAGYFMLAVLNSYDFFKIFYDFMVVNKSPTAQEPSANAKTSDVLPEETCVKQNLVELLGGIHESLGLSGDLRSPDEAETDSEAESIVEAEPSSADSRAGPPIQVLNKLLDQHAVDPQYLAKPRSSYFFSQALAGEPFDLNEEAIEQIPQELLPQELRAK